MRATIPAGKWRKFVEKTVGGEERRKFYGTLIREVGRNWHALTAGKLKYISATLEGRCAVRGNRSESVR